MKRFIRENWFKGIISLAAVIVAGSAFYYFVFYIPKYQEEKSLEQKDEQANTNSFSYQERCAEDSTKFFNKFTQGSTRNISDGYISHYNKSLSRCFVELSNELGNDSVLYELADAVEGTEYAEIMWNIPKENEPEWCNLYPDGNTGGLGSGSKNCKSKTEFDDFVKPFMSN